MSSYQLPEDQDYLEAYLPYDAEGEWDDVPPSTKHHSSSKHRKSASSSSQSGKSRSSQKESKGSTPSHSGSDTEKEPSKMSSRSSRNSPSSRRDKPSSSSSKLKKTDDWTEVTEPDERRRIQNRIAQRKFREKAREQRDRAAREAQNQQYAGSAYHIPDPEDFSPDDGGDLSGLPWGSLSIRHVVTRGHIASASTHSHSHHSGSSAMTHTPGPGPVDQALYQMNPYGYAAHPSVDSTPSSDLYAYDSPYAGAYDYDYYDPTATGGDGSHGM